MSDQFIDRARRLHGVVREALLNEWDPIGVRDVPEAKDEYDGYVPTIYKMMIHRKTKQEVFDYLWRVETEDMGLVGDRRATEASAGRLMSLVSDA